MKKLINKILYFFITKYCAYNKRSICYDNNKKINNILIFSNTALGDFLFNTPTIRSIRNKHPDAKIILVGNPKNSDFIKDYPHINKTIYWRNKYRNFISTCTKIRKEKVDIAVLLHSHSPQDIFLAWLSNCQYIIKDRANHEDLSLLHGYSLQSEKHCIQRRLDLAHKYLGASPTEIQMDIPFKTEASNVLFGSNKYNVAFQLGASKEFKTWPVELFVQLATDLSKKIPNIHFYLTGSPNELGLSDSFLSKYSGINVTKVTGSLSLRQLPDFIQSCDLLVTNDTGPLHIAIATKTPTVSMYGMTKPNLTGPYQDKHLHSVVVSKEPGDENSIRKITAEQVLAECLKQFDTYKANQL
ncbi:glycosyltransferase family 9 protein [Vibrio sp. LaRot3]|uniref:glycosyltransferase family 9 protein n=1 Tax=Vibrio sp. LaRot3 TaxID=2998829 RepID=UPI0022CDE721|nr:glycosyltransferase family 9 protein [Vibrio sp. LaRot3]MDA0149386.1 glycosyltransferase family 9 protein [Vibrio sp. LaRot3]